MLLKPRQSAKQFVCLDTRCLFRPTALCQKCLSVVLCVPGRVLPRVICHPGCSTLQIPLPTITPLSERQQLIFLSLGFFCYDFCTHLEWTNYYKFHPIMLSAVGHTVLNTISFQWEKGAVCSQLQAPSFIKASFASHQQSRSSKSIGCHNKVC